MRGSNRIPDISLISTVGSNDSLISQQNLNIIKYTHIVVCDVLKSIQWGIFPKWNRTFTDFGDFSEFK